MSKRTPLEIEIENGGSGGFGTFINWGLDPENWGLSVAR